VAEKRGRWEFVNRASLVGADEALNILGLADLLQRLSVGLKSLFPGLGAIPHLPAQNGEQNTADVQNSLLLKLLDSL